MLEGIIPVGLKRMQDGGRLQSGIARVGAQLQQPETSAITPARLAWFLSQLRPTAGLTDVAQMEPGLPSAEAGLGEFMSAEPMPGMATNISEGRYLDAALQGLGAAGDVAYASAPFTAGVGIPVGATLKGIGALGKGIRAGKAARASRGITALEPVDKMRVIADFSEKHPTAFNRLFTGGKGGKGRRGRKGISRSKFESGDPSAVERVYARVRGKQESMRLYREAEEAERVARQSRKMLFRPYTSQVESDLKRLGYRPDRRVDPDGEVFSGTSWSTRGDTTSVSNYYVHPDTGKTVRVSDHSPVYPRSNRDVMVHPGSFESYDDLVTSLERASTSTPTGAAKPIDEGIGALSRNVGSETIVHGTTKDAANIIRQEGAINPRLGSFVEDMYITRGDYGSLEPHELPSTVSFHTSINDPINSIQAMESQIGYKLGKPYGDISLKEIEEHGSIILSEVDPNLAFRYADDEMNIVNLKGERVSIDEPLGFEGEDIISFDPVQPSRILEGEDLVAFVKSHDPKRAK